jgi:ABC-2 type transport system ATP-binding protein
MALTPHIPAPPEGTMSSASSIEKKMSAPTQNLASSYRESISDSIAENRLDEALSSLQDFVSNLAPQLKDTVLLLRRRHSQYRDDSLRNVANQKEPDLISEKILEIVTQAEAHPIITPKYSLTASGANNTQQSATSGILRLVSPPEVSSSAPVGSAPVSTDNSSKTNEAKLPAPDQTGTIDDQLQEYWTRYRGSRPPEQTVAVACENVTKGYRGSRFRLDELSFSLKIGEITGVVGRNASGKTTLLRIVLGEILPDSGIMRYPALTRNGQTWPYIKRQIEYIPQFPTAWTGRVKENLLFTAAAHGTMGHRNLESVDWYVQRYGLSDYQNTAWTKLSGGYRMRCELVRALISKPKLLVLDEPLASLDVLARQEFLKNLRAVAYSLEDPVPIIVTSQHLYEIEAIADQMIILDDGKCLFCGSLEEMARQSTLRVYELIVRLPKRVVQDRLQSIGATILETIADGYIVSISQETLPRDSVTAFQTELGDRLIGIRDITASSRRFFIDALNPEKRVRG